MPVILKCDDRFFPSFGHAVCRLGIKSLDRSRIFIPKQQTAREDREECDSKTRDLEYIIEHKGFRFS